MKQCPQCKQTYADETLNFCLEDGASLLEEAANIEPQTKIFGASSTELNDEPPTAILSNSSNEAVTKHQISDTEKTAVLPLGAVKEVPGKIRKSSNKIWLAAALVIILAVGGFFGYKYLASNNPKQIESIAVLPFENASGNADLEYLSDGVSESVIDRLSQLPQLKVIARSSSFRYRGQNLNLQEIANTLGVDAIVTGRVVPRGDSYQIRVELVDARENKQLWGESFTRKASDVQILQTDIAREIADNLRLRLSGTQTQQLATQGTTNPQAYELRLKGRYYFNKFGSPEDFHKSVEYYEQALAIDPNYALAWAELSESYEFGGGRGLDQNGRRGKRDASARKALELDPNLAEAHFALANLKRDSWEWDEAEREYRRAIELNSSLPGPHGAYAALLSTLKRFDEAVAQVKRRGELDPLSILGNTVTGDVFFRARRYDEAIESYKKILELDQSSFVAPQRLGGVYAAKGMYQEAITEYQKAIRLRGGDASDVEALLGAVYAKAGMRDKAEEILQKLKADGKDVSPKDMAILYAALGMRDEAFAQLEKVYAERRGGLSGLSQIAVEPYFDNLRSDPRFADLLRRMNLPQ